MTALVLLLSDANSGQVEQIARTFGVDWPHLVAQIVSFCIVCVLLQRFAYKPVLKMLEERRRLIAQGVTDTERIKAELAETEERRREILLQANAQATQLIDEAHRAAARVQQQETNKAVAAAEQIIAKAQETAAQEHARMLTELKHEIGHLVVESTTLVTGKILTNDDQRRMAEETVKRLATAA